MNKTDNFEFQKIADSIIDMPNSTVLNDDEEVKLLRLIPLQRTKTTKPPIQLSLNEDLYRLLITKDSEIVKSWITDKEIPNYVYNKVCQCFVKIDPNIPDGEDRRKLIPGCILR